MEYLLHILILVGLYSILAVSLDLVVGHGGMLSLAQAAFFGIGAYTAALTTVHFNVAFPLDMFAAIVVAVALSVIVSSSTTYLQDDYYVIATLCFQMILLNGLNNWMDVTRGPLGIPGIAPIMIFDRALESRWWFLALTILFVLIAHIIAFRIVESPFGRVLHAIREDDIFAQALGKHTSYFKISIFAVSAALAAIAGTLYAHYVTYIDPSSFTVTESILVLSMVIVGGAGSRWGPLLGALILISVPEALRFLGLPALLAANLRQLIYGISLVAILILRPRGLIGKFAFGERRKM
jgi:branched-chain amino acid transport system permease protein